MINAPNPGNANKEIPPTNFRPTIVTTKIPMIKGMGEIAQREKARKAATTNETFKTPIKANAKSPSAIPNRDAKRMLCITENTLSQTKNEIGFELESLP